MITRTTPSGSKPTHEEISRRAYEIFMQQGAPAGRDLDHWLEAEAELVGAIIENPEPARSEHLRNENDGAALRSSSVNRQGEGKMRKFSKSNSRPIIGR